MLRTVTKLSLVFIQGGEVVKYGVVRRAEGFVREAQLSKSNHHLENQELFSAKSHRVGLTIYWSVATIVISSTAVGKRH